MAVPADRLKVRAAALVAFLVAVLCGCAGAGDAADPAEGTNHSSQASTNKTSRQAYDEFVVQMEEILAVTGETTGWTTELGKPWGPNMDAALQPRVCDTEDWENSPHRIELMVVGPGTENPQADRAAMIRYMEDQGMKITGLFGDPSYPDGVSWDASGIGENGLEITYGTSSRSRVVILYGECSTHPSMQDPVSGDTP